jgi:apolipoprotein N-acyltransferase
VNDRRDALGALETTVSAERIRAGSAAAGARAAEVGAARWTRLLAAAAAGAVGVAGFAPAGLAPLALIALAALLYLAARGTPRAAFALGYAWGAAFFGVGVSWVFVSLHDFGMMPAPLAAIGTALFCLYLALYPALACWGMQRIGGSDANRLLVLAPALWTLAEWVRMWMFTGFPWLSLGYAQIDTPLAGLAPLGGVFVMSFAAALIAGALALAARHRTRRSALPLALVVATLLAGSALARIEWTRPRGAPVSVALLQGNVPQDLKFDPARYPRTLATYARLAESSGARLVVMPETAIPRMLNMVDPDYLERLAAAVRPQSGDVLVGVPMRDASGRYYNSMVSFGASPTQAYAKSHLVPFGEFIPPGFGWLLTVLQMPLSDFSRGAPDQRPLALAGERVAPNICYEDAFGEEIIRMLPEATLLVNASNVAWFGDSLAPAQHLQISRLRALETGRYMLRATNTGVTAIVDDRGRVLAQLPNFTEGVLSGTAQGREGATPYVRAGNAPVLALVALLLGIGVARRRGDTGERTAS